MNAPGNTKIYRLALNIPANVLSDSSPKIQRPNLYRQEIIINTRSKKITL